MRETNQNTNGKQVHAVSLSGGKDSSAMLLLMIERGMPINMVLSADTGMEFPEMYEHLAKLDEHLFRERGIHITTLRHPKGFEYLMFDEPDVYKRQAPWSSVSACSKTSRNSTMTNPLKAPTATPSSTRIYRKLRNRSSVFEMEWFWVIFLPPTAYIYKQIISIS